MRYLKNEKAIIAGILLFVVGIFVIVYKLLFSLPADIIVAAGLKDSGKLAEITAAVRGTLFFVAAEFLLGVAVMIWLMFFNKKYGSAEVIYIERYIDKNKGKEHETATDNAAQAVSKQDIVKELVQSQSAREDKFKEAISGLCKELSASVGIFYQVRSKEKGKYLEMVAGYAFQQPDNKPLVLEFGEGIAGQVAKDGRPVRITQVPEGYIQVLSGLGQSTPQNLVVVPIRHKEINLVAGVIEIGSFVEFSEADMKLIEEVGTFVFENVRTATD